jgi:hypothetical protein
VFVSGKKSSITPVLYGKIAAPVFSNFLKFPAAQFSYRRIEKGTWGSLPGSILFSPVGSNED